MDVKKIISEMTLEEKAAMMSGGNFWESQAIERLGVPAFLLTDGPCGLRKQEGDADHLGLNDSVKAISYPTGSCVASSFDRALIRESGEALGDEAQAEKIAVLLGPAVNIKRSPLCGRNFEYFSEDPYVAGELAAAYIQGVQSKNVGTSIKHFALNSQEHRRMTSSSEADERTIREIYLPAFEKAVKEAQPWTVMAAYNRVNGIFASENEWLLTQVLRKEWGFQGFVVTDWGASNDRVKGVAAGCDLQMPGDAAYNTEALIKAVQNGELDEAALDLACERLLTVFNQYLENARPDTVFDYEGHHEKARRMAAESMVLLKNDGGVLPLKKEQKVAFLGKFAEKPRFQGGGSSHVNSYRVTGALEAAQGLNVTYAPGYTFEQTAPDEALLAEAAACAKAADAAVVFVGITENLESEGFDRRDLQLSPGHKELIEAVAAVNPNTVVVVQCGGCVEMPWIGQVKGLLYEYLGGEAVGPATIDLLYGAVNPSGRLAETFPLRLEDNPSYLWYQGEGDRTEYREGVFVGYRYYDKVKKEVLFPFGYGLSYTTFAYSDLRLDKSKMQDTETLSVTVKVKNTGSVHGKEVIQLYVVNAKGEAIRPEKELRGFEKVALDPGEEKEISFTLDKRAFAYWNTQLGNWHVESGEYAVAIGKNSRELVLCAPIQVESTAVFPRHFDMNSTFGDIMKDPKGAQILGQMLAAMQEMTDADTATEEGGALTAESMQAMMAYLPLRGTLMMGGDAARVTQLQQLLDALNAPSC